MLIGIRRAYLTARYLKGSTQYWTVLYWKWEATKKKFRKFHGDCFLARRLVGGEVPTEKVTISPQSPSSVVPVFFFFLYILPDLLSSIIRRCTLYRMKAYK